jgi:N-acetylmuramoyl-L-alanine amidase
MTRSDDSEILLKPRVDIANLNNADIFVSIHCNSTEGLGPMGIETYYRTEKSLPLAKFIHKNLINSLPTLDRGIRVRNFYVIKNTIMPSVLIEIGYLTNKIEATNLSKESYQKDIAKSILNGIKDYFNNKNKF